MTRPYFAGLALRATEILVACGFHPDTHRASASDPLFVRSLESWQAAGRSWLEDPTQEKALVLTSVLVDSRPAFGAKVGEMLAETFRPAREHPDMLRLLARFSLSHRPPTGPRWFGRGALRGAPRHARPERRGRPSDRQPRPLGRNGDRGGLGLDTGQAASRQRGASSPGDADTLVESFELVSELRLDHQSSQLMAAPSPTTSSTRRAQRPHAHVLKEAFRAVASVQQTSPTTYLRGAMRLGGRGRASRRRRRPTSAPPWRTAHTLAWARYCVVDLELSGLNPSTDEIISFGAVPIDGGLIAAGRSLYGLARPTRPLPEPPSSSTGSEPSTSSRRPRSTSRSSLSSTRSPGVCCGAFSRSGKGFSRRRPSPSGCQAPRARARYGRAGAALDGRTGDPLPRFVSLGQLAGAMGLPEHRPHHALSDALTTAQVFLAIVSHLEELSPETVGSLSRATRGSTTPGTTPRSLRSPNGLR